MDVDKIPFGTDFREHIRKVLLEGDILLAVIGPNWLGRSADGSSRIREDADPVRVEIETALRQRTRIIPVLVDGASMPGTADLPEGLQDLAYLNAAPLDVGRDFRAHMDRLVRSIDGMLGRDRAPAAALAARKGRARRSIALAAVATVLVGVTVFLVAPAHWFSPTRSVQQGSGPSLAPADEPDIKNAAAPPRVGPNVSNMAAPAPSKIPAAPLRSEPEPATYRVLASVSGGVQNLRSGPAVKYSLVAAIPAGATGLTLGACRASEDGTKPWCAAKWRNYAGWISSCCIVDEKTGAAPRVE